MKIELTGIIDTILGVTPGKKGFTQRVILAQPEVKDPNTDRVIAYPEFYTIHIYSTSQTDSRFLDSRSIGVKKKASLYLRGERWHNTMTNNFNYNNKLNLNQWL
ncbi:MAG: hypothetical protein V4547_10570 [Bacteroidota bacterium]